MFCVWVFFLLPQNFPHENPLFKTEAQETAIWGFTRIPHLFLFNFKKGGGEHLDTEF